jgi:hypothetical protein
MREITWIRLGLAATVAGTAIAGMGVAAGCGGGDNSSPQQTDSGLHDQSTSDSPVVMDSGGGRDTGTSDAADAAPPIPNAKVYLVHGATSPLSPPLRFCFGVPGADGGVSVPSLGLDPFPDTVLSPAFPIAGLFPGFGGSVTDSPQLKKMNLDLSTLSIALFAIDATKIASDTADGGPDGGAELPCEKVIGSDPLASSGMLKIGKDYWYVGSIPKGTLTKGTTWLGAVTGCPPGEDPTNALLCPQPYDMTAGNLTLKAWQLDNTTPVADGGLGAQFANTSSAWDAVRVENSGAATAAGFWSVVAITKDGGTPEAGEAGAEAGPSEAGPAEAGPSDGGSSETGTPEAGGTDASPEGAAPEAGPMPTTQLVLVPITASGDFGTLSPMKLVTVPLPPYGSSAGFFAAMVGADGGTIYAPPGCTPGTSCYAPVLDPLPAIDQLTYGGGAPATGTFVAGKGYVFILVGSPTAFPYLNPLDGGESTQDAGVFNSKFEHFLAFPTSNP